MRRGLGDEREIGVVAAATSGFATPDTAMRSSAPCRRPATTRGRADNGEVLNVSDNLMAFTDAKVRRWGYTDGDVTKPLHRAAVPLGVASSERSGGIGDELARARAQAITNAGKRRCALRSNRYAVDGRRSVPSVTS